MLIKINSDNPNLSFVLQKNPSSGMTIRSIRKGISYGWYNEDNYYVYFKDLDAENSYSKDKDDNIDYNNTLRYNSSLCVINLITEYFRHNISNKYSDNAKDEVNYTHTLEILNLFISDKRMVDNFNKSFPKLGIKIENRSGRTYHLIFTHTGRFSELIGMVAIFALFMVLSNEDEYLYVDDAITKKFVDLVKSIDTPYYAKYLFKVRFFGNRHNLFDKYVGELNNENHQLVFGDTHKQRIDFVVSQLDNNLDVIDYGCGEGRYIKPIIKRIDKNNRYIGFDIDVDVAKKAKRTLSRIDNDKHNHIVVDNIDDFIGIVNNAGEFNIVLSEVVEHIDYVESVDLINTILKWLKPNKLIITTPNSDFNKFYYMDDGEFRHDDHKFELTSVEFDDYITKINHNGYDFMKHNVGDIVENITPTQAVVFIKNNKEENEN